MLAENFYKKYEKKDHYYFIGECDVRYFQL